MNKPFVDEKKNPLKHDWDFSLRNPLMTVVCSRCGKILTSETIRNEDCLEVEEIDLSD